MRGTNHVHKPLSTQQGWGWYDPGPGYRPVQTPPAAALPDDDEWITRREAKALLRCGVAALQRMAANGEIKSKQVTRRKEVGNGTYKLWLYRKGDVRRMNAKGWKSRGVGRHSG